MTHTCSNLYVGTTLVKISQAIDNDRNGVQIIPFLLNAAQPQPLPNRFRDSLLLEPRRLCNQTPQ